MSRPGIARRRLTVWVGDAPLAAWAIAAAVMGMAARRPPADLKESVTGLVRAARAVDLAVRAQDEPAAQDETTLEWAIATLNARAIAIGAIALAAVV